MPSPLLRCRDNLFFCREMLKVDRLETLVQHPLARSMKIGLLLLLSTGSFASTVWEEKAVLEVVPTVVELGNGWTTNLVTYLIDPKSNPSEIDHKGDPATSAEIRDQREDMKTNGRTGCAMILYGRTNLVMNRGLFRVCIQRWNNTRSLHNAWAGWKMNPSRVVRPLRAVGEDVFWVNQWSRDTLVSQDMVFRRGLFHVTIQAGSESDPALIVRLGEAVDAKIRGRPVPAAR